MGKKMRQASLIIDEKYCLGVKVANTLRERMRGLSHQPDWDGTPMAFRFRRPCRPAFWMHGVHRRLDLIWVAGNRIVGTTTHVCPARNKSFLYNLFFLKRHYPPKKIDMAIEMRYGEVQRLGIKPGQTVDLEF